MREWLTELRKSQGITQTQLAENTGISQNYIAAIESGERGTKLPVPTAKKIAAALGFDWQRFYEE